MEYERGGAEARIPPARFALSRVEAPVSMVKRKGSIDKALADLVKEYGLDKVKEASSRLPKNKAGRPKINDWLDLFPVLQEDANGLLGKAAMKHSNRSVAKRIAVREGNHSIEATERRIMRKLGKDRQHYAKVVAAIDTAISGSWADHLKLLEELAKGSRSKAFWTSRSEQAREIIDRFSGQFGRPSKHTTFVEVRARLEASPKPARLGLTGILRPKG